MDFHKLVHMDLDQDWYTIPPTYHHIYFPQFYATKPPFLKHTLFEFALVLFPFPYLNFPHQLVLHQLGIRAWLIPSPHFKPKKKNLTQWKKSQHSETNLTHKPHHLTQNNPHCFAHLTQSSTSQNWPARTQPESSWAWHRQPNLASLPAWAATTPEQPLTLGITKTIGHVGGGNDCSHWVGSTPSTWTKVDHNPLLSLRRT